MHILLFNTKETLLCNKKMHKYKYCAEILYWYIMHDTLFVSATVENCTVTELMVIFRSRELCLFSLNIEYIFDYFKAVKTIVCLKIN